MTPTELIAVLQKLGLSDEALADDLALKPSVIRAWREGTVKIPERHAKMLRWRATIAEREASADANGFPECPWVRNWDEEPMPDDVDALSQHADALTAHVAKCQTCKARERYMVEHFGLLPPAPSTGWLDRAFRLFERVPPWGRPAALGAALLGAIVGGRVILVLPMVVKRPHDLIQLLIGIVAAMGAGASGGLAYSLTRPSLRRLGVYGDYLTGIVCVFAYMGALAYVAPIAFGESIIKDNADLSIFAIVSLFFGLVIGHSWFRPRPTKRAVRPAE